MKINLPIFPISVSLNRKLKVYKSKIVNRDYDKVFVIGFNKTGTTTLKKILEVFGFKIGNQIAAEVLGIEWGQTGDVRKIINYCYTAEAFQDSPFSRANLYKELDKAFPNSKFILTVRDDENQWFKSLVKFHTKMFSSDPSRPPSEADLGNSIYRYKGMMLDDYKAFFNYSAVPLYDKKQYTDMYLKHINDVESYFSNRPNVMLKINVSNPDDFKRLIGFLNIETSMKDFPWHNKTKRKDFPWQNKNIK
jgi:DNA polymerase III delta prime subunit